MKHIVSIDMQQSKKRERVCVYRRVLVLMILLDIVRAYCAPGLAFNHSIDQIKL
jgi:hypothetical protein